MSTWKFFPCAAGSKQPALPGNWRTHATDNDATISGWLREGYNLALDCEASGVLVVDSDGGAVGEDTWASLQTEHGAAPETFTVQTPTGGLHRYYDGMARTSVQGLGPKMDTRGVGGYVLFEGTVDERGEPGKPEKWGSYKILADRPLAPLPAWVPTVLAMKAEHHGAATTELDLPVNIARAVAWLQTRPEVNQGDGADARTFEVACMLRDFGLSADTSIDTMMEHYQCFPQDDRFEAFITRKVESAWQYAQNDAGAWAVVPAASAFGQALDSLGLTHDRGGDDEPDPYHAYSEGEQDGFKEPTWVAPDLIPSDSLVMLYGQPSSYKSFLALDAALTLASGVPGWGMPADDQRPVVFVAGEGPRSIARLRRPSWRLARNVAGPMPFHLVIKMPVAAMDETVQAFVASIKHQGIHPAVVVIDTLAKFMLGLNENDARDCGTAIAALEYIRRTLRCSVLVVHHSGKDGEKGARGSSALNGGFDTTHEVVAHKATRALAVYNRKQKDADERPQPWMFEGKEIGTSLVFNPISGDTYRALTVQDDALAPKRIGAQLLKLGARGQDGAITTHVLASSLYQGPQDEAPEVTQQAVERLVRSLRAASRGRLEAYANRDGREIVWSLPEVAAGA